MVAFGLWMLSLRPAQRVTLGFGLFASTFGLFFIVWKSLTADDPIHSVLAYRLGMTALVAVGVVSLVLVAISFPRPVRRDRLRLAVLPAAAGLLWILAPVVAAGPALADQPMGVEILLSWFLLGAYAFALVLAARRYAIEIRPGLAGSRQQLRWISAGLVLYPAVAVGHALIGGSRWDAIGAPGAPVQFGVLVLLSGLWLWNTHLATGAERRACRNLALLPLAVALAAMLIAAAFDSSFSEAGGPHWGISRMAGVLVLGYAILRHQLLGIDVKIKWTLQKSTVAAIFLAVIFLVSEGAQIAFGENQAWLGLVAGGALVFAMAPLQRFSERISDKAMPGVQDTDEYRDRRALEIYQAAVEGAVLDGVVTEKERDVLARLADQLGLSAGDTRGIERDVGHAALS